MLVSFLVYSSTMNMEGICFSETSVDFQQITRRYIPEDRTLRFFSLAFNPQPGRSVKLVLAFASIVISGFNLLEIHDQHFYFLLDMHVFRFGTPSSTKEGSVFLCRRYVCCTVVSARVYRVTMDPVYPLSLHYNK
jgi:hypothetical protein